MKGSCVLSYVVKEKQSFKASPPMSRWFRIQKERRLLKSGSRVSTHRFMAMEPMCGNFFCVNPDHMVEVAYSPAMAAAVTCPKVEGVMGGEWNECFSGMTESTMKLLLPHGVRLDVSFDRVCDIDGCVNPNHYRMKTEDVTDERGVVHKVVSGKYIDNRTKELNSYGKTWLYMDLARGIGPGARVVDAERRCSVPGCVSCWQVTKVWKCATDYGEDVSGWPWQHALESLPYGGLDVALVTSVENVDASEIDKVNPRVIGFSRKAAALIAGARSNGGHAVWDGASVNGYPLISGHVGGHRKIIEMEHGVDLKDIKLKNACGCRMCILPEHWTGWQQLKDAEKAARAELELARVAAAERRRAERAGRQVAELRAKLADAMARLNGVDRGEGTVE